MMNIGILCIDGKFSNHRKNELIGSEMTYLKNSLNEFTNCAATILATDTSAIADCVVTTASQLNTYDNIIIFTTCGINQWGGKLVYPQYLVYKFLHEYQGQIYIWFEDIRFPLIELVSVIKNRKFWENNPLCELNDLKLPLNINFLSMFENEEIVKKYNKNISIKSICKIPIYLTHLDNRPKQPSLFGKSTDLIYGGFNRNKKRNNFYKEYFFTRKNISSEIYGTVQKDVIGINTGNTLLTDRVAYKDILQKNMTGLATIIPAEIGYNNNCITPRLVEALASNLVCFIEEEFDNSHKIFNDDFWYVKCGNELEEKIIELKNSPKLYAEILKIQNEKLEKLNKNTLGYDIISVMNNNL